MKNIKIYLILWIILIFIILNVAYADEFGCCTNPGAAAKTCSRDFARMDQDCCPKPVSSYTEYYKSAENPFLPLDYNDCISNFFFRNTNCASVDACRLGCCCSDLGGEFKSEAQCQGAGSHFYHGQDCRGVCQNPQCNDRIDNDNNGCADFGRDSGCTGQADTRESGGACLAQDVNCDSASYLPKLSNFQALPARNQKKFLLSWLDECSRNAIFYDVSRCAGTKCTNLELVARTTTNSFEDSSDELQFNTDYTYLIKAHYNLQTTSPDITGIANLGDEQCMRQPPNAIFCLNNAPYSCSQSNRLISRGTTCPVNRFCVVQNNQYACLNRVNCNYAAANPFGLFYTPNGCENNRYCFYDKSYTSINSCFSCDSSMSCYDYKSEYSCSKDNCNVKNCRWKSLADDIGVGVCVSTLQSNCEWCEIKGTEILENIKSFNQIFDVCTKEKSDALSEGAFKCYYSDSISKSCTDTTCMDYKSDKCTAVQITHDSNNKITNPSPDDCGIKACQIIENVCVKNADGDNIADCDNLLCEKDYFAPETTLFPVISNGAVDRLLMGIFDKTSAISSPTLKTSQEYVTFLCVEPCGANGHPYNTHTKSRELLISDLFVHDGSNGSVLLNLMEGANVIKYYSQDPAKNIGEVKKITISAQRSNSGPKIFMVIVSDGSKVLNKFYTKDQTPSISLEFLEPAIVTFARLVSKGITKIVNFQVSVQTSKTFSFQVEEALQNGEYTFELNAKNQNNLFMSPPLSAAIVIDNTPPTLNIVPSDGSVITKPSVTIRLEFNEEVRLKTVEINREDKTRAFVTSDNKIFVAQINMTDGNKRLDVVANDLANNQLTKSVSFVVDAEPTKISISSPRFGVAPQFNFDLVVNTDNDATCRFSLDDDFEFEFMESFPTTGTTIHRTTNFNKINRNGYNIHKLYVKCRDNVYGISSNSFDISVDTSAPELASVSAFPNPIVERPFNTTLTVQSNEPVICKYSTASATFDNMGGKFEGFDDSIFRTTNRQKITLQNEGSVSYYVACINKAELSSDIEEIGIKVDLTLPMIITSHTPRFFNSAEVKLAIETNKLSQCKYSETDENVESGDIFGPSRYSHTKELPALPGVHTFYVKCRDQYLQKWSDVVAITFTVDITPPSMLFVDDTSTFGAINPSLAEKTCFTNKIRAKWKGEDQESRVRNYTYSLIKKSGERVVNTDISFKEDEWVLVENLALEDNTEYFFRVYAENVVGLKGNPKDSDGVTVNTSLCKESANCGDGLITLPGEECDGQRFGAVNNCNNYRNFIGGNLKCTSDCKLDTSGCQRAPTCDNNEIDQGESCDNNNFGLLGSSCTGYSRSFTSGNIGCRECRIDTSACRGSQGSCGDGALNVGESCDGSTFGNINECTDYSPSFTGGTLRCTPTCQLDTSSCIEKSKCGNNIIDTGELCDGSSYGSLTTTCSSYSPYFVSGELSCVACRIATSNCVSITLSCKDKGDCGLNDDCIDNSECASRYCTNKKCTDATCTDRIKNQDESDVDCGGPCRKCVGDKECNLNTDCASNFCSFGVCKEIEECHDGKLTRGESDVDCGGPCPTKCFVGKSCGTREDCEEGLQCISSECKKRISEGTDTDTGTDTDGDGISDEWEIANGLDPNDPSDANSDPDKDGLTNFDEFEVQVTYQDSTDPNNADTDGDGVNDKDEIDGGTNPLDPEDFPKVNLMKIILFILGIAVLVVGFGFLAYKVTSRRKEGKFETPVIQKTTPRTQPQQYRQIVAIQKENGLRARENLKRKGLLREKEREAMFNAFDREYKEKPKQEEIKKQETKTIKEEPVATQKIKKEKPSAEAQSKRRKTIQKKPKEDVFLRLKEIAKESKKAKSPKKNATK